MLGAQERVPTSPDEAKSLQELKRGVFVKGLVKKGDINEDAAIEISHHNGSTAQ